MAITIASMFSRLSIEPKNPLGFDAGAGAGFWLFFFIRYPDQCTVIMSGCPTKR